MMTRSNIRRRYLRLRRAGWPAVSAYTLATGRTLEIPIVGDDRGNWHIMEAC